MAFSLENIAEREQSETLIIRETASHGGKKLAVAESTSGSFVLVRERERYTVNPDTGKRDKLAADGTERKRESYWKRTADLADFRDAMRCSLIG